MKTSASTNRTTKGAALALFGALFAFACAQSDGEGPSGDPTRKNESELAKSMGITQHLGATVPKDVPFKDESGKTIRFGELFTGRPVLLVPIFYACRTGCPLVTDSVMQTLAKANKTKDELVPGRDLDVVLLSIHPKETPELAHAKKTLILNAIEPPNAPATWRAQAEKGWHLLTGDLESIHRITDAVGFKYKYDAEKNLINHPTCTIMLTPTGKISSYTIGNDFPTVVAKQELATATQNKVGEPADQSMMFGCIMLDPATGKVRIVVENVMRLAGVVTLLIVGGWIFALNRSAKRDRVGINLDRPRTLDT